MANEEIYEDDEFIINLTIDGTSYEEVEVKVSDPNKTIRDQISSIVAVFELPKLAKSLKYLSLKTRMAVSRLSSTITYSPVTIFILFRYLLQDNSSV